MAATGVFAIPAATAGGPAQGGGGCNMVANPSSTGLTQMMTGSAGSANGVGAENMAEMLSRFSPDPFCGL